MVHRACLLHVVNRNGNCEELYPIINLDHIVSLNTKNNAYIAHA